MPLNNYILFYYDNNNVMNDPFALDLTIRLLMLGLGSAMFAGSFLAFINKDKNIYNTSWLN